jgi:hypothetical protein
METANTTNNLELRPSNEGFSHHHLGRWNGEVYSEYCIGIDRSRMRRCISFVEVMRPFGMYVI